MYICSFATVDGSEIRRAPVDVGRLSQKKHRVLAPCNRWLELGFYFTINSRTQENELSLQRGPFSTSIFGEGNPIDL